MNPKDKINFAFFGSSRLSIVVLDELQRSGLTPTIIVTTRDMPQGRKLIMTPNVVKQWAIMNGTPFLDPAKLDDPFIIRLRGSCEISAVTLFIVASYGKIIPASVLAIPSKGSLNIHPSLLPKYRGPSPLPTTIIDDCKHTGVTIMRIDAEMDHGPIVAQKEITIDEWPTYEAFEEMMAKEGANLLVEVLPKWLRGEIIEREQDHDSAIYTRKTTKEDGLVRIDDLAPTEGQYLNFRKIQAYHEWPQAYFFASRRGKDVRIKITHASFDKGKLKIQKVIPENGKEMLYDDYLRGS